MIIKNHSHHNKSAFYYGYLSFRIKSISTIIKETTDEIRNGTCDPKLSHKTPVKKEPNITAKLDSAVSKPIAEPRN